jgi:hypothetical protein
MDRQHSQQLRDKKYAPKVVELVPEEAAVAGRRRNNLHPQRQVHSRNKLLWSQACGSRLFLIKFCYGLPAFVSRVGPEVRTADCQSNTAAARP